MQTGNLKYLKPDNTKPKFWWRKWLNPLSYLPHRLYKDFLSKFIGFNGLHTYYYIHSYPETYELTKKASVVKIWEAAQIHAVIRKKKLEIPTKLSYSLNFSSTPVSIKSGLEFSYKIKWTLLNFKRLLQLRVSKIKIIPPPKVKSFMSFNLKGKVVKKVIPPQRFQIKNFIESERPLLEIEPYTHASSVKPIYQIPIEKLPLNKNLMGMHLLNKFKQYLAISAKVKPAEIKLLNAFDNMYVEIYDDIKHNPEKTALWCYFDPAKIYIKNPKKYYLAFGQRLSDKKIFTIVCEA